MINRIFHVLDWIALALLFLAAVCLLAFIEEGDYAFLDQATYGFGLSYLALQTFIYICRGHIKRIPWS